MEIVIKGRHLSQDVGESSRDHCRGKLSRLEKFDHRLRRLDVELSHEPNPRRAGECERVEITVRSRGPVVRAEAADDDCYAAFEAAFAKIEERMRRAATRRTASHSHSHHAHLPPAGPSPAGPEAAADDGAEAVGDGTAELVPGLIVREKQHDRRAAAPGRGAAPDGARRARLLPVLRRRDRPTFCGLPAPGIRLRRPAAHHRGEHPHGGLRLTHGARPRGRGV